MTSGQVANPFPFASPIEQPVGLCDIIGTAFRLWRHNLPLIFRSLFLPTLCFFASVTVLQLALIYGFDAKAGLNKMLGNIGIIFLAGAVDIVSLCWLGVRQLALMRLFTGFSPNWNKALAYANKRLWWLVGLTAISLLLGTVLGGIFVCIFVLSAAVIPTGPAGAVFGALGMITGVVLGIVVLAFCLLVSMMGLCVLACEDKTTFFGIISQALSWTLKNFGR